MRRSKTYIHEKFPDFNIEEGFSENDELHDPEVRETPTHVAERAQVVLDHIFDNDPEQGLFSVYVFLTGALMVPSMASFSKSSFSPTVISITAHSGFINGLISVTHHHRYPLPTGGRQNFRQYLWPLLNSFMLRCSTYGRKEHTILRNIRRQSYSFETQMECLERYT